MIIIAIYCTRIHTHTPFKIFGGMNEWYWLHIQDTPPCPRSSAASCICELREIGVFLSSSPGVGQGEEQHELREFISWSFSHLHTTTKHFLGPVNIVHTIIDRQISLSFSLSLSLSLSLHITKYKKNYLVTTVFMNWAYPKSVFVACCVWILPELWMSSGYPRGTWACSVACTNPSTLPAATVLGLRLGLPDVKLHSNKIPIMQN